MEKRIQKDSWLRKIWTLAVAGVMAVVGAGSAWGQDGATIKKAPNTDIVHTKTEIIYVDGTRELYIPELKINYLHSFDWYIHWYLEGDGTIEKNNVSINIEEAQLRGGTFWLPGQTTYTSESVLFSESTDNGLWWAGSADSDNSHYGIDASSIKYTIPANFTEGKIICDLSNNTDGGGLNGDVFQEPTLLKRYVYEIKPAKDYVDKLNRPESEGGGPEKFEIDFPKGCSTVNFTMPSLPTNYFWGNGSPYNQGNKFVFSTEKDYVESSYTEFYIELQENRYNLSLQQVQKLDLSLVSEPVTYYVRAKSTNGAISPVLAEFTFNPIENAAFELPEGDDMANLSAERKPWENEDLYDEIGVVNFDLVDKDEDNPNFLNRANNVSKAPLPQDQTVYGFLYTDVESTLSGSTSASNQYGLFRSANESGVSEDRTTVGKKTYLWIPARINSIATPFYDRTYYNTGKTRYGYFYYIDASDDPGTIVDVDIDGSLCGYTELVVVAWLSDMTRASEQNGELPLAPNINLILKGDDEHGNEVVLHRFTSGDAKVNYVNGINENLLKWQQLCYRITLSTNVENYTNFHLEVQNNEPHTNGADYAIDDVRIYKTLPNIKVNRDNECDASTLIVGTDYATILRNMGWKEDEEVASESDGDFYTDLDYKKYRYGLMGDQDQYRNSKVGNVYFAFLSEDKGSWMTVNKAVEDVSIYAAKSLRVAVPTTLSIEAYEFYTTDRDQALINEQRMNIRAVKDYNKDYETLWKDKEGHGGGPINEIENVGEPGKDSFNEEIYQEALVELFGRRLQIPRLRCPWYEDDILKLAIIDVNNTDLKYEGQGGATGKYWVVTFSAEQIAKSGGGEGVIDEKSPCTLMSEFTVKPATTVLIDAKSPGDPTIEVCVGTVQQITAYLNFFDKETGESRDDQMEDLKYIFDWYLGPMTEYDGITANKGFSIKTALNAYRDDTKNSSSLITTEAIDQWISQDRTNHEAMGELLKDLLNQGLLLLGTPANKPFDMPINAERMVAMPYLPTETINSIEYEFCSAETEVNLQAVADPIPVMHQGFVNVSYPEGIEVALRLGWPNMNNSTTLNLPIYKVDNMVSTAKYLGLDGNQPATILLDNEELGLPPVGTVTTLHIEKPEGDGKLPSTAKMTFSLNTNAKNYLKEGQEYTLLIPFVQFDASNNQLGSACNGLLRLPVKIVPEYLTWQGKATDKWYVDDNWTQSTKKELHEDAVDDTDAHNGSDIITDAFAPLYFTNITLLGDSVSTSAELQLEGDKGTVDEKGGALNLGTTYSIQYDLAVNTDDAGTAVITPYYINKVNDIYFKPGATLLNQHLLSYTKAHVEFTMTNGKAYWMASPLQNVYAGDMYAPVAGKQHTPAFEPITYSTAKNDRWNMPFYQKAWNKAVAYMDENNTTVDVPLVQSNWNIEYNDVWVPYTIGKGFYSRVEGKDALVRLPKDDTSYGYETRALSPTGSRENPGRLANTTDGSITLYLSTVDNDGDHFLIGNPYMAYLNMEKFLEANTSVLAEKYWTVDGKNGIIVGTPDVVWPTTGSELTSGYIAPMQAFFVERKGYTPPTEATTRADETTDEPKTVTFNADMTVPAATASTSADTKAFAATNPVLTLTASSKQGQSRAAVVQKSDASNQYEADKDAVALLDSEIDAPMAYTIAGNYAAAVNAIHDYKNVPLGVYAKDGEEVELTIEGASQLVSPLYLYDAVTRSTTPIDGDSFTLNLTGSSHGRYFLTTDEGIKAEGDIRIYSPADGQLIIASTPSDRLKQVQVYDLNGRMVESRQNVGTATCQLYIPGGIYIVRVQSEQGEAQAKLKIK